VHRFGIELEAKRRERRPDTQYEGFGSSNAGAIRGIQTRAGHGCSVIHDPSEGIHHGEISYKPSAGTPVGQLKWSEK